MGSSPSSSSTPKPDNIQEGLYTACKHKGFVMITYYDDIRAATTAMPALQYKPLRRKKLDIHFSIPKDNLSEKDVNQETLVACSFQDDGIEFQKNNSIKRTVNLHGFLFGIQFHILKRTDSCCF